MLAAMGAGGDSSGGGDPTSTLSKAMAVALITTLYGTFFANFIFLPLLLN